jgi:hypothetical protein
MNQIEPTTAEAPTTPAGSFFSCLMNSYLVCVGFSLIAMIPSSIVVHRRGQYPGHDGAIFMAILLSLFGSLFGFWLPAMLYMATTKKWALLSGAACVAFIIAFFWYPEMLHAIQSAG